METKEQALNDSFEMWLIKNQYSISYIESMLKYEKLFLDGSDVIKPRRIQKPRKYMQYVEDNNLTQDSVDKFLIDFGSFAIGRTFMKNYLEYLGCIKSFDIPKIRGRGRKGTKSSLKIQYITQDDCYAFVNKLDLKLGLMCLIMFEGGLRISELLNLRWKDIDLDSRTISVMYGRGNSNKRNVTFSKLTLKIFGAYWDSVADFDKNDILFISKADKEKHNIKFERNYVTALIKKRSQEILGLSVHAHTFRHGCGFWLRQQGYPIDEIKVYLGHSSIQTTEIYAHVEQAVNVLERVKRSLK